VAIPPERLTERQIEERWPFWVYGRVTDEEGNPIRDADVTVSTGIGTLMQGGTGKTDADGRFKVHFAPGMATRRSNAAPLGVGTQAAIVHVRREGFALKEPAEAAQLQMSDSPTEKADDDATRRRVVRPQMPVELLFVLVRAPAGP
jgi:hypothetical protein